MRNGLKFYIDGAWVEPRGRRRLDVINPATEQPIGEVALGEVADVDAAVAAAKAAFPVWSQTTREQRIALLERILAEYQRCFAEMAETISREMGAPMWLCEQAQAAMGPAHISATLEALRQLPLEERRGTTVLRREPVGVCALITPWNWPINQIACKAMPALAAGSTMVLKPSEVAPLSAALFAEILEAAGVPRGVFNLVHGDGPTVGAALARHPDVDMVSFTGSTRAGIEQGATLVCGGPGRPEGLDTGYYVRPTVFANVRNDMTIAREEIFGPVLCILPYEDEEDAIRIANDTVYGLSSYVTGKDPARMGRIVSRLRAGMVHVNGAGLDFAAPFGGYKQSGNGREWGELGLHDFLEIKAVMNPAA
jgi:acyl-CoA reductase-like NAD-dependent aldehyde dehydrogenase